jgi:photosystem II stability/assembly factor-like uncharacterized protein
VTGSWGWGIPSGVVLKTINGGIDWSINYPYPTTDVNSVYFTDADTGYIIGTELNAGNSVILRTTNGGIDWSSPLFITSYNLFSVYFTDNETGYVVGESGTILKTTNGGGPPVKVIEKPALTNSLNIYPNPASDIITIETPEISHQSFLSIYNLNGQELRKQNISESKTIIDISNYNTGLYIVKVMGERSVKVGKIVKE